MASSQSYAFPFALPFPPPQDPAQHPQSTPPGASSDPQHAPAVQGFHYNGGLPGLSMQSFAPPPHSNQHSYWPPPVAVPHMSYGAVPPPPPFLNPNGYPVPPLPPNRGFAPPLPIPPPAHVTAPNSTTFNPPLPAVSPRPHTTSALPGRVVEVADGEKEEGEVNESDGVVRLSSVASAAQDNSALRSIPQVSRNAALPSSTYPPQDGPDAERTCQHVPSTQPRSFPQTMTNMEQSRQQAREFVSLLHENKIGYDVLAKEPLDLDRLVGLYRSMDLPLHDSHHVQNLGASTLAQQAVAAPEEFARDKTVAAGNLVNTQPKPPPAVKTNVATNPPAKTAPSPSDRKDYIARLQAAKAKQAVKLTPPQKMPLPADTRTNSTVQSSPATSHEVNNALNGTDKLEEERLRKNELLKQRLAKLTAQHRKEASRSATPQAGTTTINAAPSKAEGTSNLSGNDKNLQDPFSPMKPVCSTSTYVPSFTGIPGLFMNSPSDPAPAPAPRRVEETPFSSPRPAIPAAGRKRPIASDFDEVTTPRPGPVYTRPLGQSPHEHDSESMIIEVSEDDGSDMDLDEDNGVSAPPSTFSPPTSTPSGQQISRSLPPVGEFPSRPGSARPTSTAVNTPPALRTQSDAIAYQAEQLQKQTELLNLKLKIAEMTRKRKEKEALAKALGSSPAPQKSTIAPAPNGTENAQKSLSALTEHVLANNNSASEKLQTFSNTVEGQGSQKWRRERRVQLKTKLQLLDTGLQNEQYRLDQLQKELDELKAKTQQAHKDRLELIQELESLGIDTGGMDEEDLRAKKVEIVQQLGSDNVQGAQTDGARTDPVIASPSGPIQTNGAKEDAANEPQGLHMDSLTQPSFPSTTTEGLVSIEVPCAGQLVDAGDQHQLPCDVQVATGSDTQKLAATTSHVSTSEPVSNVAKPEGGEASTPVDDEEDFYSPEPAIEPAQPSVQTNAVSPSEEGDLEMSESSSEDDEEDYEPEEPEQYAAPTQRESVNSELQPASSTSSVSPPVGKDDEGVCEPLEDDGQKLQMTAQGSTQSLASDERGGDDHVAMDISTSPDGVSSIRQASPERGMADVIPPDNVTGVSIQSQTLPLQSPLPTAPVAGTDTEFAPDFVRFVPYDSPLKKFKSYRYHPNFTQDVSGGFLSMTYSHQIDHQKPLCRFESMGGSCNDPQCPDQHYRTMNLTGEKVLVELGTANPGKTAEERQRWNDGLRSVLKDLRQNNVKDPNGIAVEIAKFRRQFFNDDFHVVTV